MIGRVRTAVIATMVATGLAGCGGGGSSRLQLSDPRGSSTVTLRAGQGLVVSFPVNYGIGTDWVIGPQPAPAVLRYRRAVYAPLGPQLPGSGGRRRFFFDARAKGRARAVFLHYFRGKLTERRELEIAVR